MAVITHIKTSPVGVDTKIQPLQKRMAKVMTSNWSLTDADFFGRVYLDERENQSSWKRFINGIDYGDILYNDKIQCNSFFYVKDERVNEEGKYSATIVNIWQMKTTSLKPLITHRADEEIIQDILNVYDKMPFGFSRATVTRNTSEIYSDFKLRNLPNDLQPILLLRFDSEVFYTYSNC